MYTMKNHRAQRRTEDTAQGHQRPTRRAARETSRKALSVFMAVVLSVWAVPASAFAGDPLQGQDAVAEEHPFFIADGQPQDRDGVLSEGGLATEGSEPAGEDDASDAAEEPAPAKPEVAVDPDDPEPAPSDDPVQTVAIRFDANMPAEEAAAGSADMPDAEIALDGSETSLPESTYAREGYAFVGWSTAGDGLHHPGQDEPAVAAGGQRMADLTYTLEATRVTYADGSTRTVPQAAWDAHAADYGDPGAAPDGGVDPGIVSTSEATVTYDLSADAEDGVVTLYAQWVKLASADDATGTSEGGENAEADEGADTVNPGGKADETDEGDSPDTPVAVELPRTSAGFVALATANAPVFKAVPLRTNGLQGTLRPQAAYDNLLTVQCAGLDAITKRDGDIILYNLQGETDQTVYMGFDAGLFNISNTLEVTVQLPYYGFTFTSNMVDSLKGQSQIKAARFVKDAYGNNTTIVFTLDGSDHTEHHLELVTEFVALKNAQCAQVIQNGWQDSAIDVTVKDASGTVIATNSKYTVRPSANVYDDIIKVAKHDFSIVSDIMHANVEVSADLYTKGVPVSNLKSADRIYIDFQIVGNSNDAGLARFDKFRVYAPSERFELKGYKVVNASYQIPDAAFSCDLVPHTDSDGKTYYEFVGRDNIYNNGYVKSETLKWEATLDWRIKADGSSKYLDEHGGVDYRADDLAMEYTKPAATETSIIKGYGTCISTYKSGPNGTLALLPDNALNKRNRGNGIYSGYTVAPGSHMTDISFVGLGCNNVGLYWDANEGAYIEHRFPYDELTETYGFPFEVRPTRLTWSRQNKRFGVDKVTCKVLGSNGEPKPDIVFESNNLAIDRDYLDFASKLGEGDRVTQVVIHHNSLMPRKFDSVLTKFDFDVHPYHEGGTELASGDLLQVTYNAASPDFANLFNTDSSPNYMWIQVVDLKCPWLICDGTNGLLGTGENYPGEERYMGQVALKMSDDGTCRDYVDNPRIDFTMTSSGIGNFAEGENPLSFLSGNMTATKNLSGWKIHYGVYDTETQKLENRVYEVPDLEGDTSLSLGLGQHEYLQSFALSYDGRFTFKDPVYVNQTTSNKDGTRAGAYVYAYLLKPVQGRAHYENLAGDVYTSTGGSLSGQVTLSAIWTHDGCAVSSHHTGLGESSKIDALESRMTVHLGHALTLTQTNSSFKANLAHDALHQGSTLTASFGFDLSQSQIPLSYAHEQIWYGAVPEAMYIEITDDDVELDKANEAFKKSMADHGISMDDVNVITTGSGDSQRRWVQITTGENMCTWSVNKKNYSPLWYFPLTIAVRLGKGHVTGTGACQPFGEVYWDISDLVKNNDGSVASGLKTVKFNGAVDVPEDLAAYVNADGGGAGSFTRKLWKGDVSSEKIDVLLNFATGTSVDPGKNDVVFDTSMGYRVVDRPNMFAHVTLNAPDPAETIYNYESVLKIPASGETYSWTVQGQSKTGASDATLLLTGEARTHVNNLAAGSTVTYTYSKTGQVGTFVGAAAVGSAWTEYRYVKIHVDKMDPYTSFSVRFPVTTTDPATKAGKVSYLGGTWTFSRTQGGAQDAPRVMAPAIYQMAPLLDYSVTKQLKAPAELADGGTYDHAYPFGEGAFSFVITPVSGAPMPGGAASVTAQATAAAVTTDPATGKQVQSGGVATFPDNEYDAAGTYKYEIREVIAGDAVNPDGVRYADATDAQKRAGDFEKDGIVYTDRVAAVTVVVKEDSNGRLTASVTSDVGSPIVFTNRYEVDDVSLALGGRKTLKNAHSDAVSDNATGYSFYLELQQPNGSWKRMFTAGPGAGAKGRFTFAPVEFTQLNLDAGEQFVYRIREAVPADAVGTAGKRYDQSSDEDKARGGYTKLGVTYDQTAYTATVTLADDGHGGMSAQVAYAKVRASNGTDLQTPETVSGPEGITFQNVYDAKATVRLQATKDLAGRAWSVSDVFTFQLRGLGELENYTVGSDGKVTGGTVKESGSIPMPEGVTGGVATAVATEQAKTTSFGGIVYGQGDIGKVYVYEITEPEPASPAANMEYSKATYRALVHVVRDKGDGTIEAQVTYSEHETVGGTDHAITVHGVPSFLNKEYGHGTANVFAEKDLEGRAWTDADEFTFTLVGDHAEKTEDRSRISDAVVPMPLTAFGSPRAATATATKAQETAEFDAIHFTLNDVGRTYYYQVTEQVPAGAEQLDDGTWVKDGVAYSKEVRDVRIVVRKLSDTHTGVGTDDDRVTATVEYCVKDDADEWVWTSSMPVDFDNIYHYEPATIQGVQVQKVLKAPSNINADHSYDWAYAFDAGRFSFTLSPGVDELGNKAPMPKDGQGAQVESLTAAAEAGQVDAQGKVVPGTGLATFDQIEYTEPGRYVYTVTEDIPGAAVATIGGTQVTYSAATASGSGVTAEELAAAVWRLDGVTYTQAAHTVYVDVADNGKGQLVASVRFRGEGGALVSDPAVFTNRYTVHDAALTVSGTKTVNGLVPGAGYAFKMERLDDEDTHRTEYAPARYASSVEDGTFTFAEVVFPQFRLGKVTRYVVTEVVPDDAVNDGGVAYGTATDAQRAAGGFKLGNVTYDASAFMVTVTLEDNADGTMTPQATYKRIARFDGSACDEDADGLTFENRITPAGTATLQVSKTLKGREWEDADRFEFKAELVSAVSLADGEPVELAGDPLPVAGAVATGSAHELVDFGDIEFMPEHADKRFTYKLTEMQGSQEGITYSREVYYAVVDVVGVGDGTVSAEVAYYKGSVADGNLLADGAAPSFTNYMGLVPCKHDPPVRKVVQGSPDEPGSFTFELRPVDPSYPMMDGAVDGVKTVTQTGPGPVEFGEIEFTNPGIYDYTVKEVAGTDSDYEYDSSTWTVHYVVTEQNMRLHAERTFLKDGQPVDAMEATFTNVYKGGSSSKPNISLVKTQDKNAVKAGDEITYTLVATNNGDAVERGLYVKDYVPAGTVFVSCGGDGHGKYGATAEGQEFATWYVEELAPGASATMTLTVRVSACRAGDVFRNVAAWELTGGGGRPPASHDPDRASGGNSNAVEAHVLVSDRVWPAVRPMPKAGDPLMPLPTLLLLAVTLSATMMLVARRRFAARD